MYTVQYLSGVDIVQRNAIGEESLLPGPGETLPTFPQESQLFSEKNTLSNFESKLGSKRVFCLYFSTETIQSSENTVVFIPVTLKFVKHLLIYPVPANSRKICCHYFSAIFVLNFIVVPL